MKNDEYFRQKTLSASLLNMLLIISSKTLSRFKISKRGKKRNHLVEDGLKREFSLKGWKENPCRNLDIHLLSSPKPKSLFLMFLWQLFKYISTTNIATLTTTNIGISHDVHWVYLSLWHPLAWLFTYFCYSRLISRTFTWNSWILEWGIMVHGVEIK